jgi:hypothetical protein
VYWNTWLLLDRLLSLKRNLLSWAGIISVLCRGNSLLITSLAHKLATIHTTDVCRLICATILCVRLVLNAELDVLALDKVLVAIA